MKVAINALKYGAFDYIIKGENDLRNDNSILKKILNVMEMLKAKAASWTKLFFLPEYFINPILLCSTQPN